MENRPARRPTRPNASPALLPFGQRGATRRCGAALLALFAWGASDLRAAQSEVAHPLLLRAAKVLTCADGAPGGLPAYIDHGAILVVDGKIAAVGPAETVLAPAGAEVIDLGDLWLMPGLIDLHCHVAGRSLFEENDLNDMVLLANPELRASSAVVPGRKELLVGLAGGVTSVLYIPGSGTNMGGQGVLLKTGLPRYERMQIRNPGSLKLAQAGNPERWVINPGRSFMNWNSRNTVKRGLAYAREWQAGRARGAGQHPDPRWDVFHGLLDHSVQISAHTQVFQVVLATITMWKRDLGIDVYIDHGTIGGWKAAPVAMRYGVPAIVGPRAIDTTVLGFQRVTAAQEAGLRGVAAGYQQAGMTAIGFNTDSPVVPQEELIVQAAMAARHAFRDDSMQVVRGLTIEPARAAHIDHRVGSLEVGKDADILALTGHPADPRSSIERVWIEGELIYDPARDGRRW